MENLLLIIATTFFMRLAKANGVNRYAIGNTGCSLYFFSDPGAFTATVTAEGDVMYFNENSLGKVGYGSVTVALQQPVERLCEAETLLAELCKTVQKTHYIQHTSGLTLGLLQGHQKGVRGLMDYWQDEDGVDWKVKGWTNGSYLTVLYVRNITAAASQDHEVFLDGFRFS